MFTEVSECMHVVWNIKNRSIFFIICVCLGVRLCVSYMRRGRGRGRGRCQFNEELIYYSEIQLPKLHEFTDNLS